MSNIIFIHWYLQLSGPKQRFGEKSCFSLAGIAKKAAKSCQISLRAGSSILARSYPPGNGFIEKYARGLPNTTLHHLIAPRRSYTASGVRYGTLWTAIIKIFSEFSIFS
jgi:hypothetical protein